MSPPSITLTVPKIWESCKRVDLAELFAQHGQVEEIELDDAFQAHLRPRAAYDKHVVSLAEVVEVLDGAPKFFRNSGGDRRAPIIMVGPTARGRFLTVPLEPNSRFGTWRPVTAFEANAHHRTRYAGGDS